MLLVKSKVNFTSLDDTKEFMTGTRGVAAPGAHNKVTAAAAVPAPFAAVVVDVVTGVAKVVVVVVIRDDGGGGVLLLGSNEDSVDTTWALLAGSEIKFVAINVDDDISAGLGILLEPNLSPLTAAASVTGEGLKGLPVPPITPPAAAAPFSLAVADGKSELMLDVVVVAVIHVFTLGWIMPVGFMPTCGLVIGPHMLRATENSVSQSLMAALRANRGW